MRPISPNWSVPPKYYEGMVRWEGAVFYVLGAIGIRPHWLEHGIEPDIIPDWCWRGS